MQGPKGAPPQIQLTLHREDCLDISPDMGRWLIKARLDYFHKVLNWVGHLCFSHDIQIMAMFRL
jgi:hypothetical protein